MIALATALTACAGRGADFGVISPSLVASCQSCHDAAGMAAMLDGVTALDDAAFTPERFPDSHFPSGLVTKTVQDLITTADPAADAALDPAMPQRKAWVLHELHELATLLSEAVPPDFTSQQTFDDFATLGEAGAYEGCEIGAKLDLGYANDPEGMPPLWAEELLTLTGGDFAPLAPADRQHIKDYVDALLPGGLAACTPGEDSAS